jgi:hypothetical protein
MKIEDELIENIRKEVGERQREFRAPAVYTADVSSKKIQKQSMLCLKK